MAAHVLTPADIAAIGAPAPMPNRSGLVREAAAVMQPIRLVINGLALARAPRGNGRAAIALPGWKASDVSTMLIRQYLHALGHDSRGWGLGTNRGDVEALRDQMITRVRSAAESTGRAVNLVGWSLGGVVAREVARDAPDVVHRVVTYGSPVIGGPTFTVGAKTFGLAECERIAELQEFTDRTNPVVRPLTSVFTRRDTIVDWRACIDRTSLDVTMIEVDSTHVGLGVDPDVWLVAAKALAE